MKAIPFEQGSEGWLKARMGLATGSRFSDVMATIKAGESASKTAYRTELALERITGVRREMFVNDAMKQGTEREPFARALYESRTGEITDEIGFCLHDTLECGVSPDGLVGTSGLIEIKSPQPITHVEYMRRLDMPPKYKWQVQGQLWVMEREWCDFISYSSDFPEDAQIIIRRTYRDEDSIKKLSDAVSQFMDEVRAEAEFIANYREAA